MCGWNRAAGWTRSAGGVRERDGHALSFELLTVGSSDNAAEQLIQSALARVGVHVDIRQRELASFLAEARATPRTFDALYTGIPGDLSLAYLSSMFDSRYAGGALDYAGFHERAASVSRIEHGGEIGEREIAGNPRVERVEGARGRARLGEKGCELTLPDVDVHAHAREVGLDELLSGVVGAAHSEELERERMPVALAHSAGTTSPAGGAIPSTHPFASPSP